MSTVAWVESPLQLVGAAEWADAAGTRVAIAGRLTPQMSETADELLARAARFGVTEPYLGIPWKLLSQHRHWLIGDGFSGQFRLAAAVLRPKRITFLDDGANAIPFADTLLGRRDYSRPGNQRARSHDHDRPVRVRSHPFAGASPAGRGVHGVRPRAASASIVCTTSASAPPSTDSSGRAAPRPAFALGCAAGAARQRAARRRPARRRASTSTGWRPRQRSRPGRLPAASPRERGAAAGGRRDPRRAARRDASAGGARARGRAGAARGAHARLEHDDDPSARARGQRQRAAHP